MANARTRARELYRAANVRERNKRFKKARHEARMAAKAVKLIKYRIRLEQRGTLSPIGNK